MGFGIKAEFNSESKEGLDPLMSKTEPVKEPAEPIKEPAKPVEELLGEPLKKEDPIEPPKPVELNNDTVSAYLKAQYKDREFESLDDLFKAPEPTIREVNPYEGVMDAEDEAYLKYKKDTGRGRKDFEFLSQDIGSKSAVELSRDKIRKDTGMKLSNAEADEYLENNLDIDLSEDELSITDKIKLNTFVKAYKDGLLEEQEKYRKPLDEVLKARQPKEKIVELDNGMKMTESQYQELQRGHLEYQEGVKKAVDSVASFDFTIPIDNNGEKSELNISYELSKEDKHSMLSDALDVDATIKREFQTENGFNHSELAQTLHRGLPKNFNRIITAMAEKVRAATIEELTANGNNENFAPRPMQRKKTGKEGYGDFPTGKQNKSGFGVQF